MRIFYCAFLDVTPTMTEDTQIFTIKELHNLTSEVLCCMIETHHQISFSSYYPEKVQRALDSNSND